MKQRFTVTDDHAALLHRMHVGWYDAEFGAPLIDPKRPYGNSDVLDDMRKILGDGWTDEDLVRLHRETETVLQILLSVGHLDSRVFVREDFGAWKEAEARA